MENKLKDIFQNKLNNYQAPVDASAWSAIQSGISGGTTSGGFLASVGAKVASVIVAASLVIATVYIVTQKSETEKSQVNIVKTQEKPQVISLEKQEIILEKKTEKEIPIEIEKPAIPKPIHHYTANIPSDSDEVKQEKPVIKEEKNDTKAISSIPSPKEIVVNNSQLDPLSRPSTPITFDETLEQAIEVDFEIQSIDKAELSFQLIPSEGVEDIEILWDFGNGITSKEIQPTVYFDDEGEYNITLSFINEDKVWEVATHDVKAYYPISWEIQNIFTPNDDMYNQFFDPAAKAENITIESFVVYNNQQQVIFTSVPGLKKWDGKLLNGQQAPQGYYFYQVSALGNDGVSYSKKGKVYLITGR